MRHLRGDDGAYAILYGITIVLFIAFAGIVVDISSARADRRVNRLAADSAALGAVTKLRSDGLNGHAACTRAVDYLNDNIPGFSAAPGSVCTPFAGVSPGMCPASQVSFSPFVSGDYQVIMTWPVMDASPLLTSPDVRPGNATQAADEEFDGTEPCQRFGVSVARSRSFVFGPAVGGPSGTTTLVSSVARAAPEGEEGEAAVALILLERSGCEVLSLPNTGPTVIVQGNGPKPGGIQADSRGSGGDGTCSSGNKIFNVQQNDEARIVAAHAEASDPATGTKAQGIIGSVALSGVSGAQPSRGYSGAPGFRVRAQSDPALGLPLTSQVPTSRSLVTRSVVDSRYRLEIKERITNAAGLWTAASGPDGIADTADDVPPAGFEVIPLTHPCKMDASTLASTTSNVFVKCSGGPANRTITVDNYTFDEPNSTVIFDRTVRVGSGNLLAVTDARKVLVKGDLSSQGQLLINSGSATPTDTCATRQAAAPTRTGTLILNGSLSSTGTGALARLCSTTVVLATCPVPIADGTAPVTNSCPDNIESTGGTFEWLAPNAVNGTPTADDFKKLEDLALWGEASQDNRIAGNVSMILSGVYFLPNANKFELGGNGTQTVTNAQLIVRRLEVSGSSTFSFRPDPDDVITIPFFGGISLIR